MLVKVDGAPAGVLANPFATPVFEEPPPPPTKTCLLVSICTVYKGKFTLASRPSTFLRVGGIFSQQERKLC